MQERSELFHHELNRDDSIAMLRRDQRAAALLTDGFVENTVTLLNKAVGGNITANFYQLINIPSRANPNEPPIPKWRAVNFDSLEIENPDRVPLNEEVIIENISYLMDIAASSVRQDAILILRNGLPAPQNELDLVEVRRHARRLQPQEAPLPLF